MNRRDFLQLSLAASALAILPAPSAHAQSRSTRRPNHKRGLGVGPRRDERWREKLQSIDASWFYSWTRNFPDNIPPGMDYVPMIFGGVTASEVAVAGEDFQFFRNKYLLGFNEPDAPSQGNLNVEDALAIWPKLMELGLPLVSPGCVHPDNAWMTAFMDGVRRQSLRVDFIAVHSYGGPNADGFIRRMESVHKLYQRPIWITEFGVGDWQAKSAEQNRHSPERVLAFMEQVLPRLTRSSFIYRYAWFSARQTSAPLGTSALFNDADGSLTRLGECYGSI